MCRMLAYLGNNILLSKLLLIPEHSLEKQAWQPKELRETKLNADGFGFAWYPEGTSDAHRYRNILPIWNDSNLPALSNSMQRPLWLAIVRSATEGLSVTLDNTPPFTYQQWCFMHNGYLLNFESTIRENIRNELSAEYLSLIKGSTDSEYIFALLMQLLKNSTPVIAIQKCMEIISRIIGKNRALLNIVLSDGVQIYATRHAINGESPSLYYANNTLEFGSDNQLIASEKLNDDTSWSALAEHEIIIVQNNHAIKKIKL